MQLPRLPLIALAGLFALVATGCGSSSDTASKPPTKAEVDAQYVSWLKEANVGIQGLTAALTDANTARGLAGKQRINDAITEIDKAKDALKTARSQFEDAKVKPALRDAEGPAIDKIRTAGGESFDHAEATIAAWRTSFVKLSSPDLAKGNAELAKAATSVQATVKLITMLNAKHCPATGCDLR